MTTGAELSINTDALQPPADSRGAASRRRTTSLCVDWYAEGESRVVEVDGVRMVVRFVNRKGRRGRIAIEAPAGAAFSSSTGLDNDELAPAAGSPARRRRM